jgi:transposase
LDNATTHHTERVKELCEAAGVIHEFLPPYSPDFNPIEQSFRSLKAWLRRYQSEYAFLYQISNTGKL